MRIEQPKCLQSLTDCLMTTPDILVVTSDYKEVLPRDVKRLLSKKNLEPIDDEPNKWFKQVRYPYQVDRLEDCDDISERQREKIINNRKILDTLCRQVNAGMAAVFLLDPHRPGNLSLCLDLLASQRIFNMLSVLAGDDTSPAYSWAENLQGSSRLVPRLDIVLLANLPGKY